MCAQFAQPSSSLALSQRKFAVINSIFILFCLLICLRLHSATTRTREIIKYQVIIYEKKNEKHEKVQSTCESRQSILNEWAFRIHNSVWRYFSLSFHHPKQFRALAIIIVVVAHIIHRHFWSKKKLNNYELNPFCNDFFLLEYRCFYTFINFKISLDFNNICLSVLREHCAHDKHRIVQWRHVIFIEFICRLSI